MIISLFVLALFFIVFGLISLAKKKKIIAWFFLALGVMSTVVGLVAVYLYPHILPF
jgi:hypothetical protein